MELDLETFLIALYVMVDDLYKEHVQPHMPHSGGPAPQLSDSEVLCLGLAAQWRSGVPWKTERGFVRYALTHCTALFPHMTSQSAFNRRVRRLWGAFILLQQVLAIQLGAAADYEIMDCVPVPTARGARSFHPGWLADIARIGKGGNEQYFFGLHLLLVLNASGAAVGWILAAGNVQDRWLAELLLSARAGCAQLSGPQGPRNPRRPAPPSDWLGPLQSCGQASARPIIADKGFDGDEWLSHWAIDYRADVVTAPRKRPRSETRWLSSLRQVVETAFSNLCDSFGLKFPGAHTTWGLVTRIASKLAAYNLAIALNRHYQRLDFAFSTLIV